MVTNDHHTWDRFKRVLEGAPLPTALVDLDALDANLALLTQALGNGQTLRIATKSVRVPALLRHLLDRGGAKVRGLMTYSAHETAWLAEQGFEDLLLGYPISRADEAAAVARAAARTDVWVTVDDVAQARLLSAAAQGAGITLRLCLDVDVSWRPMNGAAHLGVRRSPIRGPDDAVRLVRAVRELPGLTIDAVLAYEAQVAGLRDAVGDGVGEVAMGLVRKVIKASSVPLAARRRRAVVDALRGEGLTIRVVNGGGSGSVHSTAKDSTCTEITAGSGFLDSHLFDGYDRLPFQPAAFFAISVARRSDPDHVTCTGGGYIASGPPGPDRAPIVHAPRGLRPVGLEGFGEVQTPFVVGPEAPPLQMGDPVICRHAKAGELAERFHRYLLVRGERVVDAVPTYRGVGQCFF